MWKTTLDVSFNQTFSNRKSKSLSVWLLEPLVAIIGRSDFNFRRFSFSPFASWLV